jgi:hypothetical protein
MSEWKSSQSGQPVPDTSKFDEANPQSWNSANSGPPANRGYFHLEGTRLVGPCFRGDWGSSHASSTICFRCRGFLPRRGPCTVSFLLLVGIVFRPLRFSLFRRCGNRKRHSQTPPQLCKIILARSRCPTSAAVSGRCEAPSTK